MPRRKDLQLSRSLIAETAAALFRKHGVSGISTRKVAAALGASPMSLYVHVGNKEGLIDVVVEQLMSSIKIDLDSEAPWTDQATNWANSLRQQLLTHPGAIGLLAGRRQALVRSSEPLVRALLGAGFTEGAAVRATRLLMWSTMGFLSVEGGVEPLDVPTTRESEVVARSISRLHELEGDPPNVLAADARGVDARDIDALFALQIQFMIEGLARSLDEQDK